MSSDAAVLNRANELAASAPAKPKSRTRYGVCVDLRDRTDTYYGKKYPKVRYPAQLALDILEQAQAAPEGFVDIGDRTYVRGRDIVAVWVATYEKTGKAGY